MQCVCVTFTTSIDQQREHSSSTLGEGSRINYYTWIFDTRRSVCFKCFAMWTNLKRKLTDWLKANIMTRLNVLRPKMPKTKIPAKNKLLLLFFYKFVSNRTYRIWSCLAKISWSVGHLLLWCQQEIFSVWQVTDKDKLWKGSVQVGLIKQVKIRRVGLKGNLNLFNP